MKTRRYIIILFLLQWARIGSAQIASWSWASSPANFNETGALSNITASALTTSSGTLSYISSPASISNASWSQSGTFSSAGKYWQVSITPNTNYQIGINGFSFSAGRTAAGPQLITVQYSLDGFVSAGITLMSGESNANTSSLSSFSAGLNLPISATTNTITFRIFGYGASSTGNFRINSISINGLTSSTNMITNYYLKSSGYCNSTSSWTDDSTLIAGNSPGNFSAMNQVFNIRNQSPSTIDAAWNVSGSGSKIILGDSIHSITFQIPASFALSSENGIDVSANATLSLSNSTLPVFGFISSLSVVNYSAVSAVQNIVQTTYGNLVLSGSGSRVFPSGTVTITGSFDPGNFTSAAMGTIYFNGSNEQTIPAFGYYHLSSANNNRILANGTIGIQGTFITGTGNYTIGTSTVDFCGSILQTIPLIPVVTGANYYNLKYTGSSRGTLADSIIVAKDVTISNGSIVLTQSTRKVLTIGGNLIINGGTLDFAYIGATTAGEVKLSGNLIQTTLFGTTTNGNTGNGLLNFCGSATLASPQTLSLETISSLNYTNLKVSSGTCLTLLSNILLRRETVANESYKGTLTVNGTLDCGNFTVNGGINSTSNNTAANFTLNSGASLISSHSSGLNSSIGTSSLIRTFAAGANYILNGNSSTAFPTVAQQASFGNPNNFTVSGNYSLNRDLIVSGLLRIDNNNTLNIEGYSLRFSTISGSGKLAVNTNTNLTITGRPNSNPVNGDNPIYFDDNFHSLGNFTLGNGVDDATVSIGSALIIAPGGSINFGSSGNKNLFTNGNIRIQSNISGTGSIGNTHGAIISGNMFIERFINSNTRRFRFLGFPFVSGVTLQNYRDDIWLSGPGTGSGTLDSGNYNSNGFHYTNANDTSVYFFNESRNAGLSNSRWAGISNINNNLEAGIGYRVFYRGPVSQGITCINGSKPAPLSGTLSASGVIKSGIQTFSIACSNGCLNVSGVTPTNLDDGWNFIANPYPCAIDWNSSSGWTKTHLNDVVYIWNPVNGSYGCWDGLTQVNAVNGIIASGQAFFVRANASNPALSCTEEVKIISTPSNMFKAAKKDYLSVRLIYDSLNNDECIIRFLANKSDSFQSNEDVIKLMNSNYNVYFISETAQNLAISYLNAFNPNKTYRIKLGIKAAKASYTLRFDELQSFNSGSVFLKDNYLHQTIDIKYFSNYPFEINDQTATQGDERFELIFNENILGIKQDVFNNSSMAMVYPNPVKGSLHIDFSFENSEIIYSISDQLGQKIQEGKLIEQKNGIDLSMLTSGIYFLHLMKSNGESQLIKLVK